MTVNCIPGKQNLCPILYCYGVHNIEYCKKNSEIWIYS